MASFFNTLGLNNVIGKIFWEKQRVENPKPRESFAPPVTDDGAAVVSEAGYYGTYLDLDGASRNESTLIARYRDISKYSDCTNAIDDIVTEAIVSVDDDVPVTINTDKLELPNNIKEKINFEFENILKLLDFNNKGSDIFRRWYIDGRLYYYKIIDEKHPKQGIQELRYLDPRKTRKVRSIEQKKDQLGNDIIDVVREFYMYKDTGITSITNNNFGNAASMNGIEIDTRSVTLVTSGILDLDKNLVLGYLHTAIRPVNHLRMMEDALVIFRVSRAPERRIFYVDVSGLHKTKAEAYLKDLMNRYKNKIVYDASTGEVTDGKQFQTLTTDFWMPRTNNGKGTEITTLPGLSANSTMDDITYFQKKLANSLNVPVSRSQPDGGAFGFGRVAEISRDELKFAKFIDRLRKRFSELFNDLLKTQLILKGVITPEEWDMIKSNIQYRFLNDTSVSEMRYIEDMRNKSELLAEMGNNGFIGRYMSRTTAMAKILRWDEETIAEEQEKIMIDMQQDMQKAMQQQQMQAQLGMQPESADTRP